MDNTVTKILRSQYGTEARPGGKVVCPFCGHKTFSIKRDDTVGKCFRSECQKSIKPGRGRGHTSVRFRASVQASGGCTLEQYAQAKRLPLKFLKELGLKQISYMSRPVVWIPYYGADGSEVAVRFRLALYKSKNGDDRFRWKQGAKPCLYGLWRLPLARKAGFIVVVEGESDAQTLWFHNVPCIGIPGANSWRKEWASYFDGIEKICVTVEPDAGGEAVRKWLAASQLRERAYLLPMGDYKDPSGLHLANPAGFVEALQQVIMKAIKWSEQAKIEAEARRKRLWSSCEKLARQPNILEEFVRELTKRNVVGESRVAKLVYLSVTSRLLERPVSIAVKGPSSGGKSFIVERTLEFFPPAAYFALTAMSERALAYSAEPLSHRMLVLYEAAGLESDFASYLVRSLLSEGRVRYETVEKTAKGMQARLIEREGPTGLLVTTTAVRLHPENETRLLSITVTDTPEQTRRVLLAQCQERVDEVDLQPWHALQLWLTSSGNRVVVPFVRHLAEQIPPVSVRLRRDFVAILTLIRAHALLHQCNRERDAEGQIVADLADYAAVRELVIDLVSEGVKLGASNTMRETVQAVVALKACEPVGGVTIKAVAQRLALDESAAYRRVQAAIKDGYLANQEERRGRPARLQVGEPLPEEVEILPTVDVLRACKVAGQNGGDSPSPPAISSAQNAGAASGIQSGFLLAEPSLDGVLEVRK